MAASERADEKEAIRALIAAHFEGLRWSPTTQIDWSKFSADFLPCALLFSAARPVQPRTLEQFIERMNGVASGDLRYFEERTLGMRILVFGNVAVVLAASELLENEKKTNHDVSAYLLVKNEGEWRISAHAWDQATARNPVPDNLR